MDKKDKTKVEIKKEILNQLIKLKEVGDTYSDVIRRLLQKIRKNDRITRIRKSKNKSN